MATSHDPVQEQQLDGIDVSVSGADGALLDGANSAIKATVKDFTSSNPLCVHSVDTNGDYSPPGAGTQYTEDAAAAANPVGNALIMVRDDALSGQTTTDGDNVAARGTDKGELYVKHVDAIPVTDNGGALTVDNGGTFAVQDATAQGHLANIATSASVLDDWDETDRAKVNIIAGQAGVTAGAGNVEANTPRVTLAADDPAVAGIGGTGDAAASAGGTGSLSAKLRLLTTQLNTQAGYLDGIEGLLTTIDAGLNTGASMFKSIDLDESEEEVKDTAGRILAILVFNRTAAPLYLKIYDADADDVTVGTTVPNATLVVPANADSDGAGFVIPLPPCGIACANAITIACTTGVADNDTGAPGANDCVILVVYK